MSMTTTEPALTQWVDTTTGEQLDRVALAAARARAHRTYEANAHIFEDEAEALTAIGVVTLTALAAFAA
jgi:hypothetical protein